jgi:UDP-3-O-[3-hydroxymyristoyl] glucosamine N-acyltransferase
MNLTLIQLSKIVSGELIGDSQKVVTNVSGLSQAGENDISFLGNLKYIDAAQNTKAGVIFIPKDMDTKKFDGKNIIKVANPQYAYGIVLAIIDKERLSNIKNEISPKAFISDTAKVADNVYVGHFAVIEDEVVIGEGTKIFPNVYIGRNVKIGKDCLIYPNVTIRENAILGDRVILQPGVVIGGDGFGFATVEGVNQKIPQIGNVILGNDVEIGANTTIDRATANSTVIGDGTKIDNLVQVAHNVQMGKNCIIVALVAIAGSAQIGDSVVIGGQTGVAGHIKIGNNVMIGAQAGVSSSVEDGQKIGGNPMTDLTQSIKIRATLRKLPQMYQDLRRIKEKLGDK